MKKYLLLFLLLFSSVAQADYIPVWPFARGGTGQATQQAAIDALAGATTSGLYLRGTGSHITLGAIQAADVPTLNQNTSGNAATVTTNANLTGPITSVGNATSIASQSGTGTTFMMTASPTATGTLTAAQINDTGEAITSSSATSLVVGQSGATNPAFQVDDSTSSSVTGIVIKSKAGGGGVSMQALDPSSNTSSTFYILPESGSNGGVGIGMSGSQPTFGVNGGVNIATVGQGYNTTSGFTFNNGVFGGDNNLNAGVNVPYSMWSSSSYRGHATGALALQEDFLVNGATDTFNAASTMTNGATLGLTYKSCGTNGTCTNESALYIPSSAVTGSIANNYGINVAASTGATANIAIHSTDGTHIVNLSDGTNAITATGTISATTVQQGGTQVFSTAGTGLSASGATVNSNAVYFLDFQPGLLTSVTGTTSVFFKASKAATVDNIIGSAMTFSCVANPTVTMYECGTSTTCAGPTTIGSVTVTAAGTATVGTVSSAAVTAGDYIGWAITAGTCTSLDLSVTAQAHSN